MSEHTGVDTSVVRPDDPRYSELLQRNFNRRFTGKPDYVRLVASTAQVVQAVQQAVHDGLRLAARSGGCCLEGFVADPAVRVVIDLSLMTELAYDPSLDAFAIEPGVTVGEAYRKLFLGWGVTLPAGQSPYIGMGGHVMGGGHSFLSREHGMLVDHLYAVEVVVVDASGTARSVIATSEPSDPNRELWWAHTGGGPGNFGIVTRYWFRSPAPRGTAGRLPQAPTAVTTFKAEWSWGDLPEPSFRTLVRNYGRWCEEHAQPDSPFATLYGVFTLGRAPSGGKVEARGTVTAGADAERLLDAHLTAMNAGVGVPHTREVQTMSWLAFALDPFPEVFATQAGGVSTSKARLKLKDAFLRRGYSDAQLTTLYAGLTRGQPDVGGGIGLATFGGRVNAVAADATAYPHRDSVLSTSYSTGWGRPDDEARSLAWLRSFYGQVFGESGGVPVPGESSNGATINHPDVDLRDPRCNRSGVPWSTLYYRDNYPRLQRAKARWDPRNVFHHALSIALPATEREE